MFVEIPVHSLRKNRNYRQVRLERRAKIVTLTESSMCPSDFRKDNFLSFKKVNLGARQ
jgi:hypothetical protein